MVTRTDTSITNEVESSRLREARARTRHYYYQVMPDKKHHRIAIWAVFLLYALIVAVQMLYPVDRALPLASFFGKNVAWQTDEQLAKNFNDTSQSVRLTLVAGDKRLTTTLGVAGAEPRTDAAIHQVTEYPFWQRFVPFSLFWQSAQIDYLGVDYNDRVLSAFAATQAKQLSAKPVNARLSIKDGELQAVSDKPGTKVIPETLETAIKKTLVQPGNNTVNVPVTQLSAETTEKDFASVKTAAETALERPVNIIVDNETFSPSQKKIASWLVIGIKKDKPLLTFDAKRFGTYLDTIDKKAGRSAGMTHVTITDGRETKRKVGQTGKAIDRSPLTVQVKAWLLGGETTLPLTAQLHDIAPKIIYNNKYTTTEAGLRAYVKDISKQIDVHIAIRQVGGEKWTASARANDSIPSASTYKVYVAKWLFGEMDAGRTSWNSSVLGTTVSDCFDQMTIASTNACAQEWLRQVGRTNMNNYVWKLGFSHGTTFTHPEATHTTANDLLRFMTMLNDGSIISGAHRDRLLHSLSVHPYRSGIPAGSNGKVYDKVGFLWDYVHDAAIIKHPRGTYIMVVMTKGQSYAKIAEITRQVERIMYP